MSLFVGERDSLSLEVFLLCLQVVQMSAVGGGNGIQSSEGQLGIDSSSPFQLRQSAGVEQDVIRDVEALRQSGLFTGLAAASVSCHHGTLGPDQSCTLSLEQTAIGQCIQVIGKEMKEAVTSRCKTTLTGTNGCKIPQFNSAALSLGLPFLFNSFHSCFQSAALRCLTHFLCLSRRHHLP